MLFDTDYGPIHDMVLQAVEGRIQLAGVLRKDFYRQHVIRMAVTAVLGQLEGGHSLMREAIGRLSAAEMRAFCVELWTMMVNMHRLRCGVAALPVMNTECVEMVADVMAEALGCYASNGLMEMVELSSHAEAGNRVVFVHLPKWQKSLNVTAARIEEEKKKLRQALQEILDAKEYHNEMWVGLLSLAALKARKVLRETDPDNQVDRCEAAEAIEYFHGDMPVGPV